MAEYLSAILVLCNINLKPSPREEGGLLAVNEVVPKAYRIINSISLI